MKLIFNSIDLPKRRIEKGNLKVGVSLIFLIVISQVLACQSFKQNASQKPMPENLQPSTSQINVKEKEINSSRFVDPILERNHRLWSEKGITDYNITVSASQGGNISYPSPALIEVRDGNAISISVNSKSDEKLIERYKEIDTIDKIFDIIQRGYEKGAKVDVKYNETFGYPADITVDDIKRGADSWIIIEISKFEIITE